MLNANVIMYSRSLTKDYRWIYLDKCVDRFIEASILNDYNEFEKNKREFLEKKHLIIRQYNNRVIVYRFFETKEKDQNSRRIYALLGCIFSELDFEIVNSLYKYFISYLYEEFDILFEKYLDNIPNKQESLVKNKEFSIDLIIKNVREKNTIKILANSILKFINQYLTQSFIIRDNSINLIQPENSNLYLTPKEEVSVTHKNDNFAVYNRQSRLYEDKFNKSNEIKDVPMVKDIKTISENKSILCKKAQDDIEKNKMKIENASKEIYTDFQKLDIDKRNGSKYANNNLGEISIGQKNVSKEKFLTSIERSELASEKSNTISEKSHNRIAGDNMNNRKKTSVDSQNIDKKVSPKKTEKKSRLFFDFF